MVDYFLPEGSRRLGYPPKTVIQVKDRITSGTTRSEKRASIYLKKEYGINKYVLISHNIPNGAIPFKSSKEKGNIFKLVDFDDLKAALEKNGTLLFEDDYQWQIRRDEIIERAAYDYQFGRNTFFFGSGVSQDAGLSSWEALLNSMISGLREKKEVSVNDINVLDKDCCTNCLLKGRYLKRLCAERDVAFVNLIRESLYRDANVRFESIIDFPYFLIHCLKTFVSIKGLLSDDGKELCESLLNDKKLNICFERVLKHGLLKGEHLDKKVFAKGFIKHLLRMRFLFDKFILKREYLGDSLEGEWSLKTLNVSGQGSNKKAYFTNTSFLEFGQWSSSYANTYRHSDNLMIQAALRVSYTSPKVMHWITGLLLWLEETDNTSKLNRFCEVAEQIARKSIIDNFFTPCKDGVYRLGVGTPHIVFNYLDYLIWKSNRSLYKDFTFEFRNSVEHWYPRHPSESEIKIWDDGGVDRFGNLCIIQRNVNSKFSNLPPEGKKSSYRAMIEKGSLKLRLMSELTAPDDGIPASHNWKASVCEEHEREMISMLSVACRWKG